LSKWRTLKLDSSFRPVQIISAFDAFCMVYMGRANIVEVYEGEFFHSAYKKFPIPSVIALKRYVRRGKLRLRCNRKNVFWRDRCTCQYCGNIFEPKELTIDHVTPRSRGGPKVWENVVASCRPCNQKKGSKLPYEANMHPITSPTVPSAHIFHTVERKSVHKKWLPYLRAYDSVNHEDE